MKVLICGDRNWTNKDLIKEELEALGECIVIQGLCKGADKLAKEAADELNYNVLSFPADWKKHGKSAGPIRNRQMLKEGQPDLVIGFHNDIQNSKGTKDMLNAAAKAGVKTLLISEQGETEWKLT